MRSFASSIVSASYFETVGIPLIRGRYFEASDIAEPGGRSRPVVILSQTPARRVFGTEDAVGRIVEFPRHKVAYEVIGVVGDIRNVAGGLTGEIEPVLYEPAGIDGDFSPLESDHRARARPARYRARRYRRLPWR